MKKSIIIIAVFICICGSAIAANKVVKCSIDSNGATIYTGKCLFTPSGKGSFGLTNPTEDEPLTQDIASVSVEIIAKGVANVHGLTTGSAINSMWGKAKRSTKDKACWQGKDFMVCAW